MLEKLDKEQIRASFEDMRRIMPDLGFEAKGYALSFEQLAQLKIPVIVYLKYRKDDHFSVLRGIDGNTVLLADPSLGHVSMSRAQFLDGLSLNRNKILGLDPIYAYSSISISITYGEQKIRHPTK